MWHTQGMWDLRTSPWIHRAMSQLWGTEELWCSIDTCDLKPPASPQFPGWGAALGLHCDLRNAWSAKAQAQSASSSSLSPHRSRKTNTRAKSATEIPNMASAPNAFTSTAKSASLGRSRQF